MINNLKRLIAGSYMSLQRINDAIDTKKTTSDDNTIQEEKVKKQEINLISKKRFYDMLNGMEKYQNKKNEFRTKKILESRGIDEDFLSFKNIKFESSLHEQLSGLNEYKYKFDTNNKIKEFASDVHIKESNGILTLNFLINIVENPQYKIYKEELVDLSYFKVKHNGKNYEYTINNFFGFIQKNPFEVFVVFDAVCTNNGNYADYINNENQITTKDELINPRNFKI